MILETFFRDDMRGPYCREFLETYTRRGSQPVKNQMLAKRVGAVRKIRLITPVKPLELVRNILLVLKLLFVRNALTVLQCRRNYVNRMATVFYTNTDEHLPSFCS